MLEQQNIEHAQLRKSVQRWKGEESGAIAAAAAASPFGLSPQQRGPRFSRGRVSSLPVALDGDPARSVLLSPMRETEDSEEDEESDEVCKLPASIIFREVHRNDNN